MLIKEYHSVRLVTEIDWRIMPILSIGSNKFGQRGIQISLDGGQEEGALTHPQQHEASQFGTDEAQASIIDFDCGGSFSVALCNDGSCYMTGSLSGDIRYLLEPVLIKYQLKPIQIACGNKHVLFLMEGGYVLSCGTGFFGQLGHGCDSNLHSPQLIEYLQPKRIGAPVVHIAAGGSHSACITASSTVYLWGANGSGQCGTDPERETILLPKELDYQHLNRTSPARDGPDARVHIADVQCGRNFTTMLSQTGRVFTFGSTSRGKLGVNKRYPKCQPYPVEVEFFRIKSMPIAKIVMGASHTLALAKETGEVYSWGQGSDGQLGHSTFMHFCTPKRIAFFDNLETGPIVNISASQFYSCAVDSHGNVFGWGNGDCGVLGIPKVEYENVNIVDSQGHERTEWRNPLPYFDSDKAAETLIIDDHEIVHDFLTDINAIVPQRITQFDLLKVDKIRCGNGHMLALGDLR
jgi:alpha-tubulin suppressor-like RCC1 family protein